MELQTRYVTKDEFREYTGIDLTEELRDQTPERFISRITIRLENYLDAHYFQKVSERYPEFTQYQKECYKHALMEQILYVIKNGDISVDSGYDPEHGVVASRSSLGEITIAPNAKDFLINCGLLTRKISTAHGFRGLWG